MEFDMQTGICSNCNGADKCTKSCILHLGKALVNFIQGIDVTETKIGEYSSKNKNCAPDLVYHGHQLFDTSSPSWLLTDINTILDMSDKFLTAYDKNAFQIANMYCKHVGMSPEETKEITDRIKAINQNKVFVLPFKPKMSCNIDIKTENGLERKKEAVISYIKWITDKETHKIDCTIGFNITNSAFASTTKMNIKEYIDRFRLSQMDIQAKGSKHDKELIKITDYGIFKPILIKEGNTGIAIDASYVYYIANGETHIIGFWNDRNELILDKNIKTKAVAKVRDNIDYIKKHKRYIAPYMLYEPNIVEIK